MMMWIVAIGLIDEIRGLMNQSNGIALTPCISGNFAIHKKSVNNFSGRS